MSDLESDSRSPSPAEKSFFDKEGSAKQSASRSRSRSRKRFSRSRSRSPGMSSSRRRYYSKSRSRSPYNRRHKKSRYRSRSRSYSPRYSRRSDDRYYRHSYRSRSRSPMSSRRRHQGTRENPRTSNCVGVFGLSLYTQERDLRDAFGRYGPIDDIQVVYDHQTGRSRGFAFIYYRNLEDAEDAKERAPGTEIDGRKIRVDFSITERAHTPTPGIYLGKPTPRGDYRHRRSPSPYYYRSSRRGYSRSRSRSRSYSPRLKKENVENWMKNET